MNRLADFIDEENQKYLSLNFLMAENIETVDNSLEYENKNVLCKVYQDSNFDTYQYHKTISRTIDLNNYEIEEL